MIDRVKVIRVDTQRLLREDYRENKAKLDILPERIATEKARLLTVRTSSTETIAGSGRGERLDRETALILTIDRLQAELKTAQNEIKTIDKILGTLDDEERHLVQVFDLEDQPDGLGRLEDKLYKTKSAIYEIYNRALFKIARLYWGSRAKV